MARKKRRSPKSKTIGQMNLPYGSGQQRQPSSGIAAAKTPSAPAKGQAGIPRTKARRRPGGGGTTPPTDSQRKPRPPKLYRIGEVVEYSGKSRQTVHNYTTMGLLPESRWTKGGHRLYDESVFERLDRIAEMKTQGKALEEIREYFARRH